MFQSSEHCILHSMQATWDHERSMRYRSKRESEELKSNRIEMNSPNEVELILFAVVSTIPQSNLNWVFVSSLDCCWFKRQFDFHAIELTWSTRENAVERPKQRNVRRFARDCEFFSHFFFYFYHSSSTNVRCWAQRHFVVTKHRKISNWNPHTAHWVHGIQHCQVKMKLRKGKKARKNEEWKINAKWSNNRNIKSD